MRRVTETGALGRVCVCVGGGMSCSQIRVDTFAYAEALVLGLVQRP